MFFVKYVHTIIGIVFRLRFTQFYQTSVSLFYKAIFVPEITGL